jgi:hypothetical protein
MPIHLPDDEVARSGSAQQLACSIDPGESVSVGSLPGVLLEHRWPLSPRLHPTRYPLSTPLR